MGYTVKLLLEEVQGNSFIYVIYCDGIKEEEKVYCDSDGLKIDDRQGL